jgi:hypothetical protein
MSIPSLRDWHGGDRPSAAHWQEGIRAIRELSKRVDELENGLPDSAISREEWHGVIVNAGPDDADDPSDFFDSRYWVKRVFIKGADDDQPIEVDDDLMDADPPVPSSDPEKPFIIVATNEAEWPDNSHLLNTAGKVLVWVHAEHDGGDDQTKRYTFNLAPPQSYGKITDTYAGGGKYKGKMWVPTAGDVATSGDLAEDDLGQADPDYTDDILILNTREVGRSTHDLDSSGYLPLVVPLLFIQMNEDGQRVYMIDTRQSKDCP